MSAPVLESRKPPGGKLVGFAVLLSVVSWGLGAFSAFPWAASDPAGAVLRVSFKHVAAFAGATVGLTQEELEKLPRHMRPQSAERSRTGKRVDTELQVALDGRRLIEKHYRPGGLRHDGPTFGYEELLVPPGRHLVEAILADGRSAGGGEARRWVLRQEIDIRPGQALLIEFSEDRGLTLR